MPANFSHVGELMAIGTALSWSIGMFPFTEAARRLGPNALNLFRLLLAVLLLAIGTVFFTSVSFGGLFALPTWGHWFWLGLSGILGLALGDYFGFSSFAIVGPRLSSVFNTLSPAAALLFGFFINDDRINAIGIFGMLITIGGIMWLSLGKKKQRESAHPASGNYKKGILFAIGSAVCQGIGVVLSQRGLNLQMAGGTINAVHASLIRMIAATAGVLFIAIISGRLKQICVPVLKNKDKGIGYAVAGTMFGPVIGMILSMQAVSMISGSVAQTIFSLLPVFVLILAHFFYKERITRASLLGALIAIGGVIILIWRNTIGILW